MSAAALSNGNVLSSILLFADNSEAAKVSRSFREASERVGEFVCRQIKMSVINLGDKLRENISVYFNREMNDDLGKLEEIITNAARTQMPIPTVTSLYDRLVGLRDHCLREEDPKLRENRMLSLFLHLPAHVHGLHAYIANGDVPFNLACDQLEREGGREQIKRLAPDALTVRYLNLVKQLPPQARSAERLSALHNTQAAASVQYNSAVYLQNARDHRGLYSYERFLLSEEIALDAQVSKDIDFAPLWQGISPILGPFLGANPPRTPGAQRAWMRDPRNAAGLNRVNNLNLFRVQAISPEIGQLRNLRYCTYVHWGLPGPALHALPPALAQLPALETLYLSGARPDAASLALIGRMRQLTSLHLDSCELQHVPQWAAQLPRLHTLGLDNNQIAELPDFLLELRHLGRLDVYGNPITVLPDALYRQLGPGDSIFGNHSIRINRQNLRQIPFRLWFREVTAFRYLDPLERAIANPNNDWIQYCLIEIANFVLFVATLPLVVLINVVIFLTSLLLLEVVEPIVTFFRDQFGYSRMVEVDPAPQVLAVE